MDLPDVFCWSRYGTETGQAIEDIVKRKDIERRENGGVFLWGIGNSIGPSVHLLLRNTKSPTVIFSPIKSQPRDCDVAPERIAVWTHAVGYDGSRFEIPNASLVISHLPKTGKTTHYALVCRAERLALLDQSRVSDEINLAALRNLKSDRPLGSSQVTAVVRRASNSGAQGTRYPVSMIAELVYPYFVSLHNPVLIAERMVGNRLPSDLRHVAKTAASDDSLDAQPKRCP